MLVSSYLKICFFAYSNFIIGFRAGLVECWPAALVAGGSFAVIQVRLFIEELERYLIYF